MVIPPACPPRATGPIAPRRGPMHIRHRSLEHRALGARPWTRGPRPRPHPLVPRDRPLRRLPPRRRGAAPHAARGQPPHAPPRGAARRAAVRQARPRRRADALRRAGGGRARRGARRPRPGGRAAATRRRHAARSSSARSRTSSTRCFPTCLRRSASTSVIARCSCASIARSSSSSGVGRGEVDAAIAVDPGDGPSALDLGPVALRWWASPALAARRSRAAAAPARRLRPAVRPARPRPAPPRRARPRPRLDGGEPAPSGVHPRSATASATRCWPPAATGCAGRPGRSLTDPGPAVARARPAPPRPRRAAARRAVARDDAPEPARSRLTRSDLVAMRAVWDRAGR